jgi:predicted acetyltransferase
MDLVKASLEPPDGLKEFLDEQGAEGYSSSGGLIRVKDLGQVGFLQKLVEMSIGKGLPDGWVPATTFWLLDDTKRVVGVSVLRHGLTPTLAERGGHMGYYVKPDQRGRGYGRTILALTLDAARHLGLPKVLVTAASSNVPSLRVIESNGGIFEDEGRDPETGVAYRRYWISV